MFECLAFVMSVVTNILNPEEEDYELITNVKFKSIDKFFNMSLLNESDVEDAFISRFGMYDVAQKSTKKESFLITTFTRMLTSINNGVYFSDARYRSQDPLEINFLSVAQKSFSHIYTRLERFVSMIPDRDFD
ncbi:hypothetical protein BFX80_09620 [Cobetia marina]|nr:hypothetical protein BFX80_09620 [Cobetia marina]